MNSSSVAKNFVLQTVKTLLEKKQYEYGSQKYLNELDGLIDELQRLKHSLRKGPTRLKYRKEMHRLQDAIGAIRYLKNVARREGIKKGLLSEGGLKLDPSDRTTVDTKAAEEAVDIYELMIDDWNEYLVSHDYEEVNKIRPVGSSAYIAKDAEQGLDVSYGDIDYLVSFPVIATTQMNFRQAERESKKKYENLFIEFLRSSMPENIDVEKTLKPGSNPMMVIVKLSDGSLVQVDTVVTHPEYREWMKGRYTPERGIKGYTIGNLYKALGDYLVMSIGTEGVLVRARDGERVHSRFSRSKGVETHRVTTDIRSFLRDIAQYLVDGEVIEHDLLEQNPGVNPENVKILGLAKGIKGLALTLQSHGVYNAEEMVNSVKRYYSQNMRNNIESKKKKGVSEEVYQKLLELNEKIISLVDEEISL